MDNENVGLELKVSKKALTKLDNEKATIKQQKSKAK